jgi:hypothetical protein
MLSKPTAAMSLEELTNDLCAAPTSQQNWNAKAEFMRRQTQAQLDACRSQIIASEAETRAAEAAVVAAQAALKGSAAAERNAKYMLGSVIVAAFAAACSAISAIATAYSVWPKK